jgi:excisionase family DNA binding protein
MNDLIKISQALKNLPISRSTLIRLIQNGKIRGVKIGRNWFVYSNEIERIRSKGTENEG